MAQTIAWLNETGRELRLASRSLRRAPGFTAAAVTSLALGLALMLSVTALMNAYLLRGMPFPAAERLYHVRYSMPGEPEPRGMSALDWTTLGDVVDLADNSAPARLELTGGGPAQEVMGLLAAKASLDALGIRVAKGRTLVAADYAVDAEAVALISDEMWRDVFGSDPQIIDRSVRAALAASAAPPQPYRIVGVLAPRFHFVRDYHRGPTEMVLPLRTAARTYMVRLREGVPLADAARRIAQATRAVATTAPPGWTGAHLESVHATYVATVRPILRMVMAAAATALLIVCVNVAVLVLLRTQRRQQELNVRISLGAGRRHIFRLLLTESALLCAVALGIALALTWLILQAATPYVETQLGRAVPGGRETVVIDSFVVVLSAGAAMVIALCTSCLPWLLSRSGTGASRTPTGSRTATGSRTTRHLRSALVAAEIAGTLALLVACGLMIRTVSNLAGTDLGIRAEGLLRARIALPQRSYPDTAAVTAFYEAWTARADGAEPSLTNFPPLIESPSRRIEVAGQTPAQAGVLAVSGSYFATLGVGVVQGRAFGPADRGGAEPVAIVSETLARRLWPRGDAVGQRVRTSEQPTNEAPLTSWRTIVGVVRDVRQSYTDTEQSDVYIPFLQAANRFAWLYRTGGSPESETARLRSSMAAIDSDVLVSPMVALDDEMHRQLAQPRFMRALLTALAAFAGLIAVLGIYGVTASIVQQRRREVAIRLALGASNRTIVRMFLRDSAVAVGAGIGSGLLIAYAGGPLLRRLLHGVDPLDVAVLAGTSAVIVLLAGGATWWPVRRALRVPLVRGLQDD